MPANAAIYIEASSPDLRCLGAGVSFEPATQDCEASYRTKVGGDHIILNVMPKEQIPEHLKGFMNYVKQLSDTEECREVALGHIQRVCCVLGLETNADFDTNPLLWERLLSVAQSNQGFVFTFNSIYLPDGTVLVGPMRE